jgi:quinol monooxygenase YgiN
MEVLVFARPGCLAYGAFRSVRDPDEFHIHPRWKDMVLDHPFKATLSEQIW